MSEWTQSFGDGRLVGRSEEPAGLLNNLPSVENTPDWAQVTWVRVPSPPPGQLHDLGASPSHEELQAFVCGIHVGLLPPGIRKPNQTTRRNVAGKGNLQTISHVTRVNFLFVCFIKVKQMKRKNVEPEKGWREAEKGEQQTQVDEGSWEAGPKQGLDLLPPHGPQL